MTDKLKKFLENPFFAISSLLLLCLLSSIASDSPSPGNIFHNIILGISCSMIAAIILWSVLAHFIIKRSNYINNFREFFNCKQTNEIGILLSNTLPWAIKFVEENGKEVKKGEQEPALFSYAEVCSLNYINKALSVYPYKTYDTLRGFADSYWENNMPALKINASLYKRDGKESEPHENFDQPPKCIIIVGSTNKNSARRYFIKNNKDTMRFCWESPITDSVDAYCELEKMNKDNADKFNCITVSTNESRQHFNYNSTYNMAIIEKMYIDDTCYFFCNGARADDSYIAIMHLFKNWQHIKMKYDTGGNDGFSICIGTEFSETQKSPSSQIQVTELLSLYREKNSESKKIHQEKIANQHTHTHQHTPTTETHQ